MWKNTLALLICLVVLCESAIGSATHLSYAYLESSSSAGAEFESRVRSIGGTIHHTLSENEYILSVPESALGFVYGGSYS